MRAAMVVLGLLLSVLMPPSAYGQQDLGVAASASGYALVWSQDGRALLQRFSAIGTPLGDPSILLASSAYRVAIGANASTYIVAWQQSAGEFVFRRLDAASGEWVDAQPISLGLYQSIRFASNGTEAIAIGFGAACGPTMECLQARRISLSGDPLPSSPVVLRIPSDGFVIREADIESNGSEYLAAWIESPQCPPSIVCSPMPTRLYATRLRADSVPMEAMPLVIEDGFRSDEGLSMAWSGGRYFIGWNDDYRGLRGTRVTAEGTVLDRDIDGGGVLLAKQPAASALQFHTLSLVATAMDNRFIVLVRHHTEDALLHATSVYVESATLAADADLQGVISLPRSVLFDVIDGLGSSLAAATSGSTFAVAASRDPQAGGAAPRAFLRVFGERRRRVVGRR
jgi:hypothetical protein